MHQKTSFNLMILNMVILKLITILTDELFEEVLRKITP